MSKLTRRTEREKANLHTVEEIYLCVSNEHHQQYQFIHGVHVTVSKVAILLSCLIPYSLHEQSQLHCPPAIVH